MDIMKLFQKNAAPAAPAAKLDANGKPIVDPNAQVVDPNDPSKKDLTKSTDPLAAFDKLWQTPAIDDKGKIADFKLDPEGLKKLATSLSFSEHVTPELAQKLQSGDAVAIKEAFDTLGRQAYTQVLEHLPQLTQKYMDARLDHERSGLGKGVKQELTRNSLKKLAANNPILSEQLETIGSQLLAKYPDATPEWIAEQSEGYFLSIAKSLKPDQFKEGNGDTANPQGDHLPGGDKNLPNNAWAGWLDGKPLEAQKTNI